MASPTSHSTNHYGGENKKYCSGSPIGQEVVPECEVMLENDTDSLTTRYSHCKKHPGHENFIPVTKFSVNDLPPEHQNLKTLNEIFRRCALTVRIRISYTSVDRPNTFADSKTPYPFSQFKGSDRVMRYGTGSIVQAFYQHESLKVKSCPCHLCKTSGQPEMKYWWVRVRTATHVIHDRSEAEAAEFDLFFDTDDRKGVRTIYGFDTFNAMIGSETKYHHDVCDVLCVTHDWSTVEAISRINPQHNFLHPPTLSSGQDPSRVIVSHPHGCSKKLTVGNILHLTIPIGEDYPVDCEIPFKKGTVYRKSSNSRKWDSKSLDSSMEKKKSSDKCGNATENDTFGLQSYDLKAKLDSVIKTSSKTATSETKTLDTTTETLAPREKYLVDFYNLFLREHCLKILLVCTVLHQRNIQQRRGKKGQNDHKFLKAVFEEVFSTFLGKELEITSNFEEEHNDSGTSSSEEFESSLLHLYWLQLWKESDKECEQFKSLNQSSSSSNMELHPSLIVLWFDEVEKILDSVVAAKLKEGKVINEDVLPPVVGMGLKAGVKILMRFEELSKGNKTHTANSREEADEIKYDHDNDNKEQNDDNDEEETERENYQTVPDGSTFILPPKAEYAIRVYGDNPGWITFPPGTIMKLPDGIRVETEHPSFEFRPPLIQPEQCYVMYNTNTCPGSSGANVYCDILGKYLGTYFPHSGHTTEGSNRSGVRANFYTLFSKMLLFDPRDVLKGEIGGRGAGEGKQSQNEPPNLFEGCKLILLNLKHILSK